MDPKIDMPIVWADCEMTGLDLAHDALIEIAVLVTDSNLNICGDGVDIVIHADDAVLETMIPYVANMHDSSGLTALVRESTTTLDQAQQQVLDYISQYVSPQSAPLAGNSIHTDRGFIARDMPLLNDFLHYRMIDVSTIKELSRRWFPRVYFQKPNKNLAHRALADIHESIAELKYYRKALFVPEPGYSTEELMALRVSLEEAAAENL